MDSVDDIVSFAGVTYVTKNVLEAKGARGIWFAAEMVCFRIVLISAAIALCLAAFEVHVALVPVRWRAKVKMESRNVRLGNSILLLMKGTRTIRPWTRRAMLWVQLCCQSRKNGRLGVRLSTS